MPNNKKRNSPAKRHLTPRQALFCRLYLRLCNATEAYIQAGYTATTRQIASVEAHKLLRNSIVRAELERLQKLVDEKVTDNVADIINLWTKAATFDTRELSAIQLCACRHCHGKDHNYHWRIPAEFEAEVVSYEALPEKTKAIIKSPQDIGGYGYSKKLIPHPDCPMCDGDGIMEVKFHDSRGYSPEAAVAFNGVSLTKSRVKIDVIDKLAAFINLARYYGMFRNRGAEKSVDGLTALIADIQRRGSKAPLDGKGDAPVAPPSADAA